MSINPKRKMIYSAYTHHLACHFGADYEVCPHWRCRFAYWIERVFGLEP